MPTTWSIIAVLILVGFAVVVTLVILWLVFTPAKPRGFEVQLKDDDRSPASDDRTA
jgi:hypothetical protein